MKQGLHLEIFDPSRRMIEPGKAGSRLVVNYLECHIIIPVLVWGIISVIILFFQLIIIFTVLYRELLVLFLLFILMSSVNYGQFIVLIYNNILVDFQYQTPIM